MSSLTPDQIKQHAQSLIDQLGLSPDVIGVADEKIGYGNYGKILGEYQRMMNDMLVLIRELGENVAQLQVEKDTKLPQPGSLP